MKMLKDYGLLSGYEININKTRVLALNLDPPAELHDLYEWKWDADNIKYLGVTLPRDCSKIFDICFSPLNSMLKSDIQK